MKKRDLLLADSHILELEQECNESAVADRGAMPQLEDATSPGVKDGGRRKAKDVELLYEELQKELWAVVRESLRSPTAGPNLGLVVQVRMAAAMVTAMETAGMERVEVLLLYRNFTQVKVKLPPPLSTQSLRPTITSHSCSKDSNCNLVGNMYPF